MQEEQEKPGGALSRLWKSRRSFKGFGLLLFYCHMLMLFSVLARTQLAGVPEYAMLLSLGKVMVPLLFSLTTLSLFLPRVFWPALALACLHIPAAAVMIARGPATALPWLLGLAALVALLALTACVKLRN